jgi:chromosome segregation ATPase
VTLAVLGELEEDAQVSVDTQLGPEDRTPTSFIAAGSDNELVLDPYALIQLPAGDKPEADAPARSALAQQTLRAEALERQLVDARAADKTRMHRIAELEAQIGATEVRGGEHVVRAERLAQEVSALEREVAALRERAVDLEDQASDYKRMHAHSEVELTAVRAGFADLEERLATTLAELEVVRAVADVPGVDPEAIERLAARAEAAEALAAQLETDLANVGDLHAEELAQLETALRERARHTQMLEQELVRRERLVKELVAQVQEAHHQAGHAPAEHAPRADEEGNDVAEARREAQALRDKLDHLALEFARREGEIEARGWKIAELEGRLAITSKSAPDSDVSRQLATAQSELDALRQALTQEHEARARVESGEALAKAHAELARQATLIEQLSRELDARDRRPQATT